LKTPEPPKENPSAPNSAKFTGTDNPRHLRAIVVLLRRPLAREDLDSVAGCSNGPALVAALRDKGLTLPCDRIEFVDRDGRPCRPGVYSLTASDRRLLLQWMARQSRRGDRCG
jgi:hypothetical protein